MPFWERGSHLRYRLFFRLEANLTQGFTNIHALLRDLEETISHEIQYSVGSSINIINCYLTTDIPCNLTTNLVTYAAIPITSSSNQINVKVLYNSRFVVTSLVDRTQTESVLLQLRNGTFQVLSGGNVIEFSARPDVDAYYVPSNINILKAMDMCYFFKFSAYKSKLLQRSTPLFETVSDMMTCKQISITDFRISTTTHKAYVEYLHKNFDIDQYTPTSSGAIAVCIEDYTRGNSKINRKMHERLNDALGIFTAVCTCLSLVGLFFSFITYCMFKSLRTLPGINNMCLILSLFFAQATFQFGTFLEQHETVCLVVGIVSHYFWLATFSCMSVCCLHMFLTFNIRFLSLYDKDSIHPVVTRYCLFSFGLPSVIVALNFGVIMSVFGNEYSGYGPQICFLTNPYSIGLSLALPLIVSTAANIIFFAFTMKNIRSSSKIRNTKVDRQQCVVYVKLFVLTGLTWLLQIIDSNVAISAFSFIVTFLNGCQGVFIFISYTCNRRVYLLYKNMCCKRTGHSNTTSKSGTSEFKSRRNTLSTHVAESRT